MRASSRSLREALALERRLRCQKELGDIISEEEDEDGGDWRTILTMVMPMTMTMMTMTMTMTMMMMMMMMMMDRSVDRSMDQSIDRLID
ncbi:hypothetical protein AK812_SmicGene26547 [Symbiodinium microadriaticum]|uniref:Uncharacterized protein n=1 Tax=Symbiodinium microadriaticum TaxID=2951 RepID=A0A1Q9D926_SYMMI|nr:hypothetical protein AK812_SmicGene26547 [Symbiodinium microadriaticum]